MIAVTVLDTACVSVTEELDCEGSSHENSRGYEATTHDYFRRMMNAVVIDYRDFVFMDIGSRKGHVLILASA